MIGPHFSRRASAPSRRMIWRDTMSQWWGGAVIGLVIIIATVGYFQWRNWQRNDAADAPLRTTTALVKNVSIADVRGRIGNGWTITLEWGGRVVISNTHNFELVKRISKGDSVGVAYRVGKSGSVYVEDFAATSRQPVRTNPGER